MHFATIAVLLLAGSLVYAAPGGNGRGRPEKAADHPSMMAAEKKAEKEIEKLQTEEVVAEELYDGAEDITAAEEDMDGLEIETKHDSCGGPKGLCGYEKEKDEGRSPSEGKDMEADGASELSMPAELSEDESMLKYGEDGKPEKPEVPWKDHTNYDKMEVTYKAAMKKYCDEFPEKCTKVVTEAADATEAAIQATVSPSGRLVECDGTYSNEVPLLHHHTHRMQLHFMTL